MNEYEYKNKLINGELYEEELKNYLEMINQAKEIIIWGASKSGKIVYNFLKEVKLDYKIIGFTDNDSQKWGKVFNGLNILSSNEAIKKAQKEDNLYIVNAIHILEIKEQLMLQGIKEERIDMKGYFIAFSYMYKLTEKIIGYIRDSEEIYPLLMDEDITKEEIEKLGYLTYLSCMFHKEKTLNKTVRQKEVIASLTSYPARFKNLHLVIESIFRQTYKPDKILLCLSEDVKESDIPQEILSFKRYGLSIIIQGKDIKPHKKYYYAMKMYPESIIITFDDDGLYRRDTIEKLIRSYQKFPDCVSCMTGHQIQFEKTGQVKPYKRWKGGCADYINEPRMDLIAVGVGGILYPPNCMNNDLFDIEKIFKFALNADDIWLKVMQLLNKTKVVIIEEEKNKQLPILTNAITINPLSTDNLKKNNDKYLKDLLELYHIDLYQSVYES